MRSCLCALSWPLSVGLEWVLSQAKIRFKGFSICARKIKICVRSLGQMLTSSWLVIKLFAFVVYWSTEGKAEGDPVSHIGYSVEKKYRHRNNGLQDVSWAYRNTPSFSWWYRFRQKPNTHWAGLSKWMSLLNYDSGLVTFFMSLQDIWHKQLKWGGVAHSFRGFSPCSIGSMFLGLEDGSPSWPQEHVAKVVHIMTKGKQKRRKSQGTKYILQNMPSVTYFLQPGFST